MKKTSDKRHVFVPTDSGLLVPVGMTMSFNNEESFKYSDIKQKAIELKELFERKGFLLNKSPSLNQLINDAIELSDAWLCNSDEEVTYERLFSALQIYRIAISVLPIEKLDNSEKILGDLLNGSVNLLERSQSKAKDTLWELELLLTLKSNGINAAIGEPDLVYSLSDQSVGIACKKLYSEANVSKVLSNAVSQIENTFELGIIALNIDDLLPANSILQKDTVDEMSNFLGKVNDYFLHKHERHLRRYLEPGRAISVLVACSTIADVKSHKQRILNARQSTMWHIPGLPAAKERQINELVSKFSQVYANG
jgi:hypothetical protein